MRVCTIFESSRIPLASSPPWEAVAVLWRLITFISNDLSIKPKGEKKGRGYAHKHKVLSLVDRDAKQVRSMVVDNLSAKALTPILQENIAEEAPW